jgi:tetratricopeptide (TPR) repeat protein
MHPAHDDIDEGLRLEKSGQLDRALSHYEVAAHAPDPLIVSTALRRRASVLRTRGEWDAALMAARESAAVAEREGLTEAHAEAINAEAAVFQSQGHFDVAIPLLEKIIGMTSDARIHGVALQNLGSIAAEQGDLETAEHRFLESYRCFREARYAWGEAFALNNYGRAALERARGSLGDRNAEERGIPESGMRTADPGSLEIPLRVLADAVELARAVEDLDLTALATMNLAEARFACGDTERAEDAASEALGFFEVSGNRWRHIECLRLLGDINRQGQDRETAERCYAQALDLARSLGVQQEIARLEQRLRGLNAPGEPND